MQISMHFQISCHNLKIRGLGAKLCVAFLFLSFVRNYHGYKSKSLCFLLSKNIKFNKNETESKIENPTHSFRDMHYVLQLE